MKIENIHGLFESQVVKTPNAIAVQIEDEQITYKNLNARANQLARHLVNSGNFPGETIGLYIESSVEVIVAILAILKSGCNYVPLNPLFPKSKTLQILKDTGTDLILTISELRNSLPENYNGTILELDKENARWEQESKDNLDLLIPGDGVAYIAYTSGSTGRPKGVQVMHKGTVNFLNFLKCEYPITQSDITLQMIPFYFNGSVREVFGTLVNGAQLILLKAQKISNANAMQALMKAIEKHNVTLFLSMVPAVMKHLIKVSRLTGRRFESIKLILSAGETIYYRNIEEIHNTFGDDTQVISQYGQTESSGVATYFKVTCMDELSKKVPIGKPIDNTTIYIFDDNNEPVEPGEIGHIYICGPGVAKGYLNQPEKTKEVFVKRDIGNGTFQRMLKTGDTGCLRDDGNIEFNGRNDDMIILDGYRVELGEVERTMQQHPKIQNAAVSVIEDVYSNQYLNCYYIPHEDEQCTTTDLIAYSTDHLPHYMIPSAFLKVNAFPLRDNGKLDRHALVTSA